MQFHRLFFSRYSTLYNFTPVFFVTIRPHVNSKREIIKTSHVQNFLFFVILERIRKGSYLPKKKVGVHPTKIFSHQVNATAISTIFCRVIYSVLDVARACLSSGRERP